MCVEASVLFSPALSSFSETTVKTLEKLHVRALAYRATVTGAEEGHVCAEEKRRIGAFARGQVTVTQVWVVHSGQTGKTDKQGKVQFSRLKFLLCCVLCFYIFELIKIRG